MEPVSLGDFGDFGGFRIATAQGAAHLLHAVQSNVAVQSHTQVLLATRAPQAPGYAKRGAEMGGALKQVDLQQRLEASQNIPMPASGRGFPMGRANPHAIDQAMQQLLLQSMRRRGVGKRPRSGFGHLNSCSMEVTQIPLDPWGWLPSRNAPHKAQGSSR